MTAEGAVAALIAGMNENMYHESMGPHNQRVHDSSYGLMLASPIDYSSRTLKMVGEQGKATRLTPGIDRLLGLSVSEDYQVGNQETDFARQVADPILAKQMPPQALTGQAGYSACSGGNCGYQG
jgi:hypothetical protein